MNVSDDILAREQFRGLSAISQVLMALAVFGLSFVPLRGSQDEWWHLKTGKWIWENRGLPVNDIFTYTGEDIRWYNHEWLSQVLFYGVYRLSELMGGVGLTGLIFFKSLVIVAVFYGVGRLCRQRGVTWPAAGVIALVAADISRRTINPRPPIFSYLLLAVFLLLLYGWKLGRIRLRTLWMVLVPLTVVWANMHGMVLLSIVAVGAFAGGEFLEGMRRWWCNRRDGGRGGMALIFTRTFWALSGLTVAMVVACLAQPSGYHLFFLGRNFTADPLLQKIILEMLPTPRPFAMVDPAGAWWDVENLVARPPGFWTFWVALVVLAALWVRNGFRFPYGADYLLVGFFTYQAVMHWRLLPLFAIAAAGPMASLVYGRTVRWHGRRMNVEVPVFCLVLAMLVGWFNFTVAEPPPQTFFRRNVMLARGETGNLSDYPAPLMDYIIDARLPGRMFSDSNYCGYAMWRLSPEHHKLFTDNRFDIFGSEFIAEERAVFFAVEPGDRLDGVVMRESWQDILDRYGVNFVVFRPVDRRHLFEAIKESDEWRLAYYYIAPEAIPEQWPLEGYYLWVRNTDEADEILERSEKLFLQQFPDQPPPGFVERLI